MKRRAFLGGIGAVLGGLGTAREASATLLRGLSLEQLSKGSDHILVGTALEATSRWEVLGGRRRIVTDTRVRVDDVVAQATPGDLELEVRTLGGTIGDIASLVYGEATLSLEQPCLLFLANHDNGRRRVVGMAQGHYPLLQDGKQVLRLIASPRMPELVPSASALAFHRLVGKQLTEARVLVREALAK